MDADRESAESFRAIDRAVSGKTIEKVKEMASSEDISKEVPCYFARHPFPIV